MKKLLLCSDIHLNHLSNSKLENFCLSLLNESADGILITGDITESTFLKGHLEYVQRTSKKKVYFVLGNHDYWKGSFNSVKDKIVDITKENENLFWLRESGVIELSNKTALVGVDGWYDGGYGSYENKSLFMNDWNYISDFVKPGIITFKMNTIEYSIDLIMDICKAKAKEEVDIARKNLLKAFQTKDKVIFATHIPPWKSVSKYKGQQTDTDFLPFYTSKIMGDMLLEVGNGLPTGKHISVYCGHTHDPAHEVISNNITAYCSHAEYGKPKVSKIIDVE